MTLAPIIVFGYNRPDHYQKTLEALSLNRLADQSVLYLYCDGAREGASKDVLNRIAQVRTIAHNQHWAKETHVIESDKNKGLADSIIGGVTEIVNQYGRVIVLEDDMVTSPGFLQYMNDALEMYKDDKRVMHITGYMYPHKWPLPETFFYEVPHCWSWATWDRAWKYYSNDTQMLYEHWQSDWNKFDKFGGDVLSRQLIGNYMGTIKTWFVKWHATVLMNNGLSLYPGRSLVSNIGFGGDATNCVETNIFDVEPAKQIVVNRRPIKESKIAAQIIYSVYQGRWYNKRRRKALINKILLNLRLCR